MGFCESYNQIPPFTACGRDERRVRSGCDYRRGAARVRVFSACGMGITRKQESGDSGLQPMTARNRHILIRCDFRELRTVQDSAESSPRLVREPHLRQVIALPGKGQRQKMTGGNDRQRGLRMRHGI